MDIEIKAEGPRSFKAAVNREAFVKLASGVVSAGTGGRTFEPYTMNSCDRQWVIDAGNDWFLTFDPDDETLVRIRHRYGDTDALQALATWAAYRWRGTVVTPQVAAK